MSVTAQSPVTTVDLDTVFPGMSDLLTTGNRYRTLYVDPPWSYGNNGTRAAARNHYKTLDRTLLQMLPVDRLADENAHLHLWTTNAFIEDALILMREWGFSYKSCFVWTKPQMGLGNYWRVGHELLLFGMKGKLPFGSRRIKSWVTLPRTKHSAKPEEIRKLVEIVSPEPRLELFARRQSPGWTAWGNQL